MAISEDARCFFPFFFLLLFDTAADPVRVVDVRAGAESEEPEVESEGLDTTGVERDEEAETEGRAEREEAETEGRLEAEVEEGVGVGEVVLPSFSTAAFPKRDVRLVRACGEQEAEDTEEADRSRN